jgi:flagellin
MSIGFISNQTAAGAKIAMDAASKEVQTRLQRLASGEKIIDASDDVTGGAIGNLLAASVRQLSAMFNNAAQAKSMLAIASGALKNIQSMLVRQQELATQAAGSTIDDTSRALANKEFTNLSAQIDQIAGSTTFNGIQLINGSLFAPAKLTTDVAVTGNRAAIQAESVLKIATKIAVGDAGDFISINGVDIYARTTATMSSGDINFNLDVTVNNTEAKQAEALQVILTNLMSSSSTEGHIVDAKARLRELIFDFDDVANGNIGIKARVAGKAGNSIQVGGSAGLTTSSPVLTLDGTVVTTTTAGIGGKVQGVNGALSGGQGDELTASATLEMRAPMTQGDDEDSGNTLTFTADGNTATFTFLTTALSTTADPTNPLKIDAEVAAFSGGTKEYQMQVIKQAIDSVLRSTDNAYAAEKAVLEKFDFTLYGNLLRVTAKTHGAAANDYSMTFMSDDADSTAGVFYVDGVLGTVANDTKVVKIGEVGHGTYISESMLNEGKLNGFKASGVLGIDTAFLHSDLDDRIALSINGASFDLKDTAGTTAADNLYTVDIEVADDAEKQIAALYAAIQAVKAYTGADATTLAKKALLAELTFSIDTTNNLLRVTSEQTGSVGNAIQIARTIGAGGNGTIIGKLYINGEAYAATGTTVTKDLATFARGTYVQDPSRTVARGIMGDDILLQINSTGDQTNTGISVANISNNPDFLGKINHMVVTATEQSDIVNISLKMGDITYTAQGVNTAPTSNQKITFFADGDQGGSFFLQMQADNGVHVQMGDTSALNSFTTRLNGALAGITVSQQRGITSYQAGGNIYPVGSTTASGSLTGTSLQMVSSDFTSQMVDDVVIASPVAGSSDATIKVTIGGVVYQSQSGMGSTLDANTTTYLVSSKDPSDKLIFKTGTVAIRLDDISSAQAATKALKTALGIGNGEDAAAQLQVGLNPDDVIKIAIKGASTQSLHTDEGGNYSELSIATQQKAQASVEILKRSIQQVAEINAAVGALQARFGYASDNLVTSMQNLDAARSVFLDADIAKEATASASAQVRLQASISALAQANQLTQNVLRLIDNR